MNVMQIALGLKALKSCLALGLILSHVGASHYIGPNKERMVNAFHFQVAMLHRNCLQQGRWKNFLPCSNANTGL